MNKKMTLLAAAAAFSLLATQGAQAQKKYDPGASDSEIKLGNTCFYSGPASSYGTIGRCESAFFSSLDSSATHLPSDGM